MTWYPIAFLPPQYEDSSGDPYSGAVLKAYSAGTTTPIPFATGYDGATTSLSLVLNAYGYPAYGGNVVIPHVQENYKLALYPNQTAADANTGAVWTYDNIKIQDDTDSSFVQYFSGDASTTEFTLSQDLGTDEKAIMVFADRDSDSMYREIRRPNEYTLNGTSLTLSDVVPSGTNNIIVFAPSLLLSAANSAAAAAAISETNAANSAATAEAYADDIALVNTAGGFINDFINPDMKIWQDGTSGTISSGTPAYTADGWIVGATGANPAWAKGSVTSLPFSDYLYLSSASGLTDCYIRQRLRGSKTAKYNGQQVTVQAEISNATGASITPTITVKKAGSLDSWGSPTTIVNAASMQSAANGTNSIVAYTFTAPSDGCQNGIEVTIDFGSALNGTGTSIGIGNCDIRITPDVPSGVNNSPPRPEVRPKNIEKMLCQAEYWTTFSEWTSPASGQSQDGCKTVGPIPASTTSSLVSVSVPFPVPMSAKPTVTTYTPLTSGSGFRASSGNTFAAAVDFISEGHCTIYNNATTEAAVVRADIHLKASCRL